MNAKIAACLFFPLLVATTSVLASEGPPPKLNPTTYVSPSGVYSLAVSPTDIYGRGPADCRLTKQGKVVWQKRLPFTFWKAIVADSGRVAGYAYTCGWRGFSEEKGVREPGKFIVAVLSAEGKTLNQEKHAREWSRFPDFPPNPLVEGTAFDATSGRFVVRVRNPDINQRIEQWWVFDVNSGKRIGTLEPGRAMPEKGSDEALFILHARAVPGTPLVLIQWWKYASGNCGAVFTLVDLDNSKAKPLWSLTLDGDYMVPGNGQAEVAIREKMRDEGAILDLNKSPGFAILAAKQQQRIAFSIEKAKNGSWQVRETTRTPYKAPAPKPVQRAVTFPQLKPVEVGVVRLGGTGPRKESPIRDIRGFGFAPNGNICILTVLENTDPHLLYVSQEGKILKDLRVPVGKLPEVAEFSGPASVGDRNFVIAIFFDENSDSAQGFRADFDVPAVKRLPELRCAAAIAIAGFPNGDLAALTRQRETNSVDLSLLDSQGKAVLLKDGSYYGRPDDFLGPVDITRYGDRSAAVLENTGGNIRVFDTKGRLLRRIKLENVWNRKPSYPTHITEDAKGGFAVYDFGAPMPMVRMNADGRIQSQFAPKFSDGRAVKGVRGLNRSPDGRLWTTDGDVLLRLADNGKVDRILGEEAVAATVYQPMYATVDLQGRVYVADRRTNSVHVFDSNGRTEGVCVPDPKDLTETSSVQYMAVAPDGAVFISPDMSGSSYIRFDRNLKRTGRVRMELDDVDQNWHFQPFGPLCWIGGYEDVFLVKDLRKVVRKISRRADWRWLEHPSSIGVAPDGSIAVVAASQSGEVSLNTYSPTGDPRATYVGPRGWSDFGGVAYDGQSIFFRDHNDVYVIDKDDRCIGTFRLPSDAAKNPWEGPFLAAGGKQLWFVDCAGMTLHKFLMPRPDSPPPAK
jgi:hypothetical protein